MKTEEIPMMGHEFNFAGFMNTDPSKAREMVGKSVTQSGNRIKSNM